MKKYKSLFEEEFSTDAVIKKELDKIVSNNNWRSEVAEKSAEYLKNNYKVLFKNFKKALDEIIKIDKFMKMDNSNQIKLQYAMINKYFKIQDKKIVDYLSNWLGNIIRAYYR